MNSLDKENNEVYVEATLPSLSKGKSSIIWLSAEKKLTNNEYRNI